MLLLTACAIAPLADAQNWTGANLGTDMNWSDPLNWGGTAPTSSSAVTFPDGAYPLTTNTQGAVNNIVDSSQTIASLTYDNLGSDYVTTKIPAGTTLTITGGLTVGVNNGTTTATPVAMTGGGSLIGGNSGTATFSGQNGSGNGSASVLDLSGLATFVFNPGASSSGAFSLGTGGSGSGLTLSLASVSNNITAGTLNIGNNNTRGANIINLGNGTNIINADTINLGINKATGTMQFLNNAGGGVKIANHTGTGRTTFVVSGESSSGTTGANNNGSLLFNGGSVNILAGTMTVGNRAGRGGGGTATGLLAFNSGVVDATTLNLAVNTSAGDASFGTVSVGGGTLIVGNGGLSLVNQGGIAGQGSLIITNGGTLICSNNIYKTTGNGTGLVWVANSTINLASLSGTIGVSNNTPIDIFDLTNSVLTLPVASPPVISVVDFNPDATTSNTINISVLPSISSYPVQYQLITYQVPAGNLNSFALGSLPGGFSGYISNNLNSSSIDLVVTNGPSAKADEWGGGINNQWDTTTLNWTNNGVPVTYNDLDFVTFDDSAHSSTVNLTGTRQPATLNVNNSVLNYTFTGVGKISGPVQLVKNGTASLTLSETGGDNFSLGIMVNAGTVVLDDTNSSISGGLTIQGGSTVQIGNNDASGSLPSGALDDEGSLIFSRTNNVLVSTVIPGGGSLTQNGTGTLALSAVNTYNGPTTVSAGTLSLTNSGAINSGSQVSVSSATLDVSGVTTAATFGTLSLANATLNVKVGYLQTNLTVSSLNLSGTANTINVRSLPPINFYPATVTLLQNGGTISGYNFVLGSLPAGDTGTIGLSADQTAVQLTLTSGPTGTRSSVYWGGTDWQNNVSTNWSDPTNWVTVGVPAAAEKVIFNDIASTGNQPFDNIGDGINGVQNPAAINNIVDTSITNAGLTYGNSSAGTQNTLIAAGKTLTVNGPLAVSGGGGLTTILGAGGSLLINNPGNSSTLSVENGAAPTLDMSGLDNFTGTVSQIAVGFNLASPGSVVNGVWYMAKTNLITTGGGFSGTSAALVVGGANTQTGAGSGQVYLGQTNALFVDGIVVGIGASIGSVFEFNPTVTNHNPVAYFRGISGSSSRVTLWSLGDDTANLNAHADGYGEVCDFSNGKLDALVNTLVVGQGSQGNVTNGNVMGTFNMGLGTLDVTTLKIGASGVGPGGNGIGVMNVYGGTVLANSLNFCTTGGDFTNTSGTLGLTNATLVVSNGLTIGSGTAGASLFASSSTVKLLNGGTLGTPAVPFLNLGLDGATLQLGVDAAAGAAPIVATNVTTGAISTINLSSISNVTGTVQIPLLSYTGTDPYAGLKLGTYPAGYTVSLADDTANSTVDLSIVSTTKPTPHITHVSVSGITLTLAATNGADGGQFILLGTTNLAKPLNQWTPVLTNSFDGSGNLNLSTNIISPTVPQQFFILVQ